MNFMSGRPGFYEEMTGGAGAGVGAGSSSRYPYPIVGGGDEMDPADVDSDDHVLRRLGGEGSISSAATAAIPREHMFDKVVTPSDVGKLNRLVIPKQHAEKYFPLDSTANEKGLLLNFEDRNGKPWRFRYSYWNSSQSYVMTKGWSRFVKEKRLDAGDIVSFQRGVGEIGKDRLFIDWRRRPDAPEIPPSFAAVHNQFSLQHQHRSMHPWSPLFINPPPRDYLQFLQSNNHSSASASVASQPYHHHHLPAGYGPYGVVNGNPCLPGSILYLRSGGGGGGGGIQGPQRGGGGGAAEQMVFESVPVVHGKAAAKRLRLFGVNMDCPISDAEDADVIMSPPSTNSSTVTLPLLHHLPSSPPSPYFDSSPSSSSFPSDLQLRPSYSNSKGKGSMSLDLDI